MILPACLVLSNCKGDRTSNGDTEIMKWHVTTNGGTVLAADFVDEFEPDPADHWKSRFVAITPTSDLAP